MFRLMLYNLFLFSCSHCFTNCFPQFSFTDSASILNDKGEDTDSFVAVHSESCLTVHQAPLSMQFPRQEYWSGLPFLSPKGHWITWEAHTDSLSKSKKERKVQYNELHCTWKLSALFMMCAAAAKSLQSCPTLCDPIDGSPPGSPTPGILQARTLEWVAISFSSAWKWKVKGKLLSLVWLFATAWAAAYQAPLSMGFSRQEYWSGVPLPSALMMYSD